MRGLISGMAILASMAASLPCSARGDDEPEALIRQGNDLRRRGETARAYGYFKRAYDISHTPRSAAQLGLVEQALGRFVESESHLSEGLSVVDPWIDQNRPELEALRQKARARLGRVELRGAPAGAMMEIAGGAAVPAPQDSVVWVTPGDMNVRVSVADRAAIVRRITVAAGESITIDAEMPLPPSGSHLSAQPPEASPPPLTESPKPSLPSVAATPPRIKAGNGKWVAGLAIGGAGVALGIAGLLVYRSGADKVNDINRAATNGDAYNPIDRDWKALADIGIGLMVGGAIALAGGAIMYLWSRNDRNDSTDKNPSRVGLVLFPGDGWTLRLSKSF